MSTSRYKSFKNSKRIGDVAEEKLKNILDKLGDLKYNATISHDIEAVGQYNFTVEVKHDLYANKSGNIAIEFFNTRLNKPSGINASEADFWVIYLNDSEIYLVTLSQLRNFIVENKADRTIYSGGDNNANLYLYEKSRILPIFTNLHQKTQEELEQIFKDYIMPV